MADTNMLMWFFTSYLGINPSQGCTNGCGYCMLERDVPNPTKVTKKETAKYTLEAIMKDKRVSKRNPLALYNLSDPFLKDNLGDLLYILEGMENKGQENIVVLITKLNPDKVAPQYKALDRIAKFKHLRPVIMVSYANAPKEVEPASKTDRLELMATSKELKIPVVQYTRPLWEGWTPMDKVHEMAEETAHLVTSVVVGGIVMTDSITQRLKKRGVPIPPWGNEKGRYMDEKFKRSVIDAYKKRNPDIGVFVNSSCGISHALKIPNYMGYYRHFSSKSPVGYCQRYCHPAQRERCGSAEPPIRKLDGLSQEDREKEEGKVQLWMDKFNASRSYFNICDGYIEVFFRMAEQEARWMRQHTGVFVYSPYNFKNFEHRPTFF
ncbi:radical SAM protein [Candidatus Woesearchaeota archaeon]|nr:radical SAM protein [Candidatus Woesearchaeota archaeon]